MKIKEILNEGLLSSYATGFLQGVGKGLMPDTLRKVYPDLKKDPFKGDPSPVELAHDTIQKHLGLTHEQVNHYCQTNMATSLG